MKNDQVRMIMYRGHVRTDALTNGFLLGTFYVRKVAKKALVPIKYRKFLNGINLILNLLAPFICK